jgi:hypothetical protein
LIKLLWNVFALPDSMQKGEMTSGVWLAAASFLFGIAGIGVPTILLYDRHPDASPRVLIGPAIALGALLVVDFVFAIRWRLRLRRERAKQEVK